LHETAFLLTYGNAIIGTQEIVRDASTRVLDRYLLPEAQQEEAATIQSALDVLFGSESEREP
jgi:hypothetical protein